MKELRSLSGQSYIQTFQYYRAIAELEQNISSNEIIYKIKLSKFNTNDSTKVLFWGCFEFACCHLQVNLMIQFQ